MNKTILLVLAAAALALAGLQWQTMSRLQSLESALRDVEHKQAEIAKSYSQDLDRRVEAEAERNAGQQEALDALREEVEAARRASAGSVGRVREEAQDRYQELSAQLKEAEQKLADSQARVAAQLSGVRQAGTDAQSGIRSVTDKVESVETKVASARSELGDAVSDLQRTRGDLGQLSGLIATNAKQIEALRTLGDREYIDFTLFKRKDPVPVGEIGVILKNTDEKKQRYTIELVVNDQRIEKKDRSVNEPLQFYVGSRTQLHELVINRVAKDQIEGYLARPKTEDQPAREGAR